MMVMGDGPPKERGRHRTKVENDIISRRERDFRHQQMWSGAVDYYKRWDKINTKFDEWTSPRYYEDNNKMLGDIRAKRDKEELMEKRRSRLKKLLDEEEKSWEIELMVKKNADSTNKPQGNKNRDDELEVLKEVNNELKSKEDEKRRREAELKLYHQWRKNNPIVRQYESRYKIKDLKLSWLDQQIEKKMQKEKEENDCKMFIKQQEDRMKREQEQEVLHQKEIDEKKVKLKENLDKQIEELKNRQQISEKLKNQEDTDLRNKLELENLEKITEEEETRRLAKECALYNIKQHKLKLKQKAIDIQEDLEREEELLLKMKSLELQNLIQDESKKNEIKEGLRQFLDIIKDQKDLEKRRQKHLEFIFESEAKSIYNKQLEIWNKEEMCRKTLLQEVLDTVKNQIADNLKINKERQKENLKEREKITKMLEEYDQEVEHLKAEEEKSKQMRKKLLEEDIQLKKARKKKEEHSKLKEIDAELERVRKEEERLQKEILEMQRKRGPFKPLPRSRLFF
ncbi:trichoplein keratin filament-binding protein-like isoform X2 [Rhynchophorus ferrugineus]